MFKIIINSQKIREIILWIYRNKSYKWKTKYLNKNRQTQKTSNWKLKMQNKKIILKNAAMTQNNTLIEIIKA